MAIKPLICHSRLQFLRGTEVLVRHVRKSFSTRLGTRGFTHRVALPVLFLAKMLSHPLHVPGDSNLLNRSLSVTSIMVLGIQTHSL